MRAAAPALALLPFLLLSGCGAGSKNQEDTLGSAESYGNQTGAAASTPSLIVDAATQIILNSATGNAGELNARSVTAGPPRVAKDGNSGSVNVASLTWPDGAAMFPNASGSITVTWTGTTVNSWPTSIVQSLNATVTVTTSNLTSSDPTSGRSATVNGSLVYDLDGTISATDRFNWSSDLTTDATISSSSPLTISVTKDGATETVSISGRRKARHQATSTETSGATTVTARTGTRTFTRTIYGAATNPAGASDGLTYSEITASKSGGTLGTISVIWNRSARFKGSYDYTSKTLTVTPPTTTPTGTTGDQVYDRTFLTLRVAGATMATVGPKTASEMATYITSNVGSFSL